MSGHLKLIRWWWLDFSLLLASENFLSKQLLKLVFRLLRHFFYLVRLHWRLVYRCLNFTAFFSQTSLVIRSVRVIILFEEVELGVVGVVLQDESNELGALGFGLGCNSLCQFVYDGLYIGRGYNNLLL